MRKQSMSSTKRRWAIASFFIPFPNHESAEAKLDFEPNRRKDHISRLFLMILLFPYFFQREAVFFGTGEISDVDFFNNCRNQTLVETIICDIWRHIDLLSGIKVNKKIIDSKFPEISLPQDASTHLTNINIRARLMGRNRDKLLVVEHWFLFPYQFIHNSWCR